MFIDTPFQTSEILNTTSLVTCLYRHKKPNHTAQSEHIKSKTLNINQHHCLQKIHLKNFSIFN